jgi:hypothetical protein
MDMDCYVLERLAEARLTEARKRAAHYRLVNSLHGDRQDWCAGLALHLVTVARWLRRGYRLRWARSRAVVSTAGRWR